MQAILMYFTDRIFLGYQPSHGVMLLQHLNACPTFQLQVKMLFRDLIKTYLFGSFQEYILLLHQIGLKVFSISCM